MLTAQGDNVKHGNSVVAEPSPLEAWRERFPAAHAASFFETLANQFRISTRAQKNRE